MLHCRTPLVVCILVLAVGCSHKTPPVDPGPSLAEQLSAAQELAAVAEERHLEAVGRREEVRELQDRAIELASPETVDQAERTLEKLEAAVEEARVARDAARNKLRTLAHQLTAE